MRETAMTLRHLQRRCYLTLPVLFLLALLLASGAGLIHPLIELAYVVASLVAFVLHGHDKRQACHGAWRTPESMLHLSELFCGWPGAMLAQAIFRHKTAKFSYQLVFWLCLVLNLAALTLWSLLTQN